MPHRPRIGRPRTAPTRRRWRRPPTACRSSTGLPARRFHARRAPDAGTRQGRGVAAGLGRALHHRRLRQRPRHRGRPRPPRRLVRPGARIRPHRLRARRRPDRPWRPARQRHRHQRRPRHHGGGEPRRGRGRRADHRLQHHPAARAGAERLFHPGPDLPLPLFRHAQDAPGDAGQCADAYSPAASAPSTICSSCGPCA